MKQMAKTREKLIYSGEQEASPSKEVIPFNSWLFGSSPDVKKAPIRSDAKQSTLLKEEAKDVHKNIMPYLDPKMLSRISQNCRALHSIYQPNLNEVRLKKLFQAIIDDEIKEVNKLLDAYPYLVLEKPNKTMVIESQHTWQKFDLINETTLSIATKRRQIEMIEILLPYFDKLQNKEIAIKIKEEALSKWPSCERKEEQGKFFTPPEYVADLQAMIDVFTNDVGIECFFY
jgi:hypothetical protein